MTWDMSERDRPTAFVDIDNTLLLWQGRVGDGTPGINDNLISRLMAWKRTNNGRVYLWSYGGETHCKAAAKFAGIETIVDGYAGKPTVIIDDDPHWLGARTAKRNPSEQIA